MRKLHINGEVWTYLIRGSVRIHDPNGKKFIASLSDIKGISNDDIERGQWKKTTNGMIFPGEVKAYIEKNLVNHERQAQNPRRPR